MTSEVSPEIEGFAKGRANVSSVSAARASVPLMNSIMSIS